MAEKVVEKPNVELPDVEMNIYSPKDPVEATVVENEICTASSSPNFVRHITFDISGTKLQNNVVPGQAFGILPPGKNEKGKPHKLRLYSTASPTYGEDGEGKYMSTTVKRVLEEFGDDHKLYKGVCSNYLCDLVPGDKVKMTGPSGRRFVLPQNPEKYNYVFFATGTGIAPFRAMVKQLLNDGHDKEIILVFGCPYRTDYLYPDLFHELEEQYSNFTYLKNVSREDRRPDGSKKYVQTSIVDDKEILEPVLKQNNTLVYMCGLEGMETGIYELLAKEGYMEYLKLKENKLSSTDPNEWGWEDLKKGVKASDRTFIEVY